MVLARSLSQLRRALLTGSSAGRTALAGLHQPGKGGAGFWGAIGCLRMARRGCLRQVPCRGSLSLCLPHPAPIPPPLARPLAAACRPATFALRSAAVAVRAHASAAAEAAAVNLKMDNAMFCFQVNRGGGARKQQRRAD